MSLTRILAASIMILATVLLAACGENPDEEEAFDRLSVADWAARFCSAAERLEQDIAWTEKPVGDETLRSIADRKTRARNIDQTYQVALNRFIDAVLAATPPHEAQDYAIANMDQASAILAVHKDTGPIIQAATSHAEIEATNTMIGIVTEREAAKVQAASQKMDKDVQAALRGVHECGQVSVLATARNGASPAGGASQIPRGLGGDALA